MHHAGMIPMVALLASCVVHEADTPPDSIPAVSDTSPCSDVDPIELETAVSFDWDGDGWTVGEGDCDDASITIRPGATEVCDPADHDEDCNGLADDADPGAEGQAFWYQDADADGFGNPSIFIRSCDPVVGWVADATDCEDQDGAIHPDAEDDPQCDGIDQDCDGSGASTMAVNGLEEYDSLQDALSVVGEGGVVRICPGNWEVNDLVLSRLNLNVALTSWSGDAGDTSLDGGLADNILAVYGPMTLQVEDLTFHRGVNGAPCIWNWCGGAIYALEADLTVERCSFMDNYSGGVGGAIALLARGATSHFLQIQDSVFDGNTAEVGGAFFAQNQVPGEVVIERTEFRSNWGNQAGGVAELCSTNLAMRDSVVSANGALGQGMFDVYSLDQDLEVNLERDSFEDNFTTNGASVLQVTANTFSLSVVDGSFLRNTNDRGGTAPIQLGGDVILAEIERSVFEENESVNSCGVLYVSATSSATVGLVDSVFTANSGMIAGVMVMSGPEQAITSLRSTFTDNSSTGPGVWTADVGNVLFEIEDSVFEGNTSSAWLRGQIGMIGANFDGTVRNSVFRGNTNMGTGSGASVMNLLGEGQVEFIDTVIEGNANSGTGAAIYAESVTGPVSVRFSGGSVVSNTAAQTGGGLWLVGADLTAQDVDMGTDATDNGPSDIMDCPLELGAHASFTVSPTLPDRCVEQ